MKNGRRMVPQEGSYLSGTGTLVVTDRDLRRTPQRPCPVCCRYLRRDRDMILIRAPGGERWVCKSNLEIGDTGCGFAYPRSLREGEVRALARGRAQYLLCLAAGVTSQQLGQAR